MPLTSEGLLAGALAVIGLGLVIGCLWLSRQLRLQGAQWQEREAGLKQQLQHLQQRLELDQAAARQARQEMHFELRQLQEKLNLLGERVAQQEQKDPGSLSFSQAAHLVSLGAGVEDLTRSCGLSQAEAELVRRIHGTSRGTQLR